MFLRGKEIFFNKISNLHSEPRVLRAKVCLRPAVYALRSDIGFTLIEVIITAGIIAVLAGLAIPVSNVFLSRNELNSEALKIVDALRRARIQSMSAAEDSIWGVHFTSADYTVFRGPSYNPAEAFNDTFSLPGILTVSGITINGGGNDIIFDRITGNTSTFGTTTIQNDALQNRTIIVNQAGTINLQ